MVKWTDEQRALWEAWLAERPMQVRTVAERISPEHKYRLKGVAGVGNYYVPVRYDEADDGSVTLTCNKLNDEMPFFGGYAVFGMNPDELERIEE